MSELIFLKLGGSLLTDKTQPKALRARLLSRVTTEIAEALAARPWMQLLIGHGSGSFGHVVASRYGTRQGVSSSEAWRGYAETAHVAAQLNRLVVEALWESCVPALPVQPSASARCRDGELEYLDDYPLRVGLEWGLVPVLYGDVALDDVRGGTIVSTEQIFCWLAPRLGPQRILLVGEVMGVLTADPASGVAGELVGEIDPTTYPLLAQTLGGSRGVDVTGGMLAKVAAMVSLVQSTPSLAAVQIISGLVPGLIRAVLCDSALRAGTRIKR